MWMVLHHYKVWPSTWKDKRDGSGWGETYTPFRCQHSARRISLSLLSDRHNYGAGAHVFLTTARGVTRGHGISLSNQPAPAQPIWVRMPLLAFLASSVVSERSCELNDALMLEKVPPVAKEQRLAVASVRTAVKVRGEDVFIKFLILWDGRTSLQGISHMSSIATCPLPFSVIAVWFAVEKHIFHCHNARRISIWWQSAIIYSTHDWRNGNIYSIVTVLRDLAPDDNNYTPLVEGKHIFHCHSAGRLNTWW